MNLFPYQAVGAEFLAARPGALLADAVRVGKTGAAIGAADRVGAEDILEITKGAARRNHARAWSEFQTVQRKITPIFSAADALPNSGVVIISYDLAVGPFRKRLKLHGFDAVIPDECHKLKNRGISRTKAIYGEKTDGDGGLVEGVKHVWPLSGTPAPNNFSELWTTMRAVFPDSLRGANGKPMSFSAFKARFCIVRDNGFGDVIVGNRNHRDLRERLAPYMLRRTLGDVRADHPPVLFDTLELDASGKLADLKELERDAVMVELAQRMGRATSDEERLKLAEKADAMVKGRLRRLTGLAKVEPLAGWIAEQLEDGLESLVVFGHHREVIDGLMAALAQRQIGSAKLYGGSTPTQQQYAQDIFQSRKVPLFLGNIQAAGEAIDLSAADQVVFIESSYVPGENEQAAHRVVNVNKPVSTLARFATLPGSIDEAIQRAAARKAADTVKLFG